MDSKASFTTETGVLLQHVDIMPSIWDWWTGLLDWNTGMAQTAVKAFFWA